MRIFRYATLSYGLAFLGWVVAAVVHWPPARGAYTQNHVNREFYAACAQIFPVHVIAGVLEIGAQARHRVPGFAWEVPAFLIPSVGGEIVCLRVLAGHASIRTTYNLVWFSLGYVTAMLLLILLSRPPDETSARE